MKDNYLIALIVALALVIMACDKEAENLRHNAAASLQETSYLRTIILDSCEYYYINDATYYGYEVRSITHKGNCKNCRGKK